MAAKRIHLTEEEYVSKRGETYTVAALSAGSVDVDVLLNWTERF